jgi:hypothetical protein
MPPDIEQHCATAREQVAWIIHAMGYLSRGDEAHALASLKSWSEFKGDTGVIFIKSRTELFAKAESSPKWIAKVYAKAKSAVEIVLKAEQQEQE